MIVVWWGRDISIYTLNVPQFGSFLHPSPSSPTPFLNDLNVITRKNVE
jgi:hypothetical protein